MILASPFVTAFKMALIFGKYITSKFVDDKMMSHIAGRTRKDFIAMIGTIIRLTLTTNIL